MRKEKTIIINALTVQIPRHNSGGSRGVPRVPWNPPLKNLQLNY